jgi:predicted metal-dependent hydrolase
VLVHQLQSLWNQLRPVANETSVNPPDEFGIQFRRNPLAKRYRLYIDRAGQPRVTIPRRGTLAEARIFAAQHRSWIQGQLEKFRARQGSGQHWTDGTEVLFRGERHPLRFETRNDGPIIQFGGEVIPVGASVKPATPEVRRVVERHLRKLAEQELPSRVQFIAGPLQCVVARVSVRNQRTRWGSCSRRGTVSLNWRLIQVPEFVRDYIIIHELMHLREMNHSARFWKHVEAACPDYCVAEAWLKSHPGLLSRVD